MASASRITLRLQWLENVKKTRHMSEEAVVIDHAAIGRHFLETGNVVPRTTTGARAPYSAIIPEERAASLRRRGYTIRDRPYRKPQAEAAT